MDKSFMMANVSSVKMFLQKDSNLKGVAHMQNFYNSGK